LGTGLGSNTAEQNETFAANVRSSPKKSGGGPGRASLGSGSADAWTRFDKDSRSQLGHAKAKETEVQQSVREVSRQMVGSPRGSPAPASPGRSTRLISPVQPPSSPVFAVDISTLIGPEEFGDGDVVEQTDLNPTAQWREGVEPSEFVDDDEVRNLQALPGFEPS
jgi:kinetochore protein Spc7/SPC105